ncbi:DUF2634 domain-containing protein [Paenibacillus sp. P13VS]|uniref:contractile injection system sheath initiator n=1 Tax=Paenibacillus sp. P13VS TaxID=2697367 RepID=UPI00187BA41D|nr:DUF2634 domain-containing protein [Paenibacillus sp. P13VS]MBE7682017.1 DUF2634 domain-containing protein [Paenibacillus sp. P13VS]
MQSLKLENGDIQFDDTGELLLVEETEELAQCCEIGLGTRTGEWFLNPDLGIDFDLFRGKDVNEEEMRDELNRALLEDERIESVEEITFSIDRRARVMTVAFVATGTNGEIVEQEGVEIGVG